MKTGIGTGRCSCEAEIPKADNICEECFKAKPAVVPSNPPAREYRVSAASYRTKHCFWCGTEFTGWHSKVFCEDKCRVAAHRAGKRRPKKGYVNPYPGKLKLRFNIFERDGFRCRYCGREGEDVELQIDHVNPESNGGLYQEDNLVTSCWECNMGKGDRLLRQRELREAQ